MMDSEQSEPKESVRGDKSPEAADPPERADGGRTLPHSDIYEEVDRDVLDEYGLQTTKDLYHPHSFRQRMLDHLFLRLGIPVYFGVSIYVFLSTRSLLYGWGTFFGVTFVASIVYFALVDTKDRGLEPRDRESLAESECDHPLRETEVRELASVFHAELSRIRSRE